MRCGIIAQLCTDNLEQCRLPKQTGEPDEGVLKRIEEFLPFRNEAIQVFAAVARYAPHDDNTKLLHIFFERLIPYLSRPSQVTQWQEWEFDNFRFIVHELFLYYIAILLKSDRLEQAAKFSDAQYFVPNNSDSGRDVMVSFTVFRTYLRSFDHRNKRLKLNRLSLRADLLKQRCIGVGLDFRDFMQADFLAFMRADIQEDNGPGWWPETPVYVDTRPSPFEVFARSVSKAYFDRAKQLLRIKMPSDLAPLLDSYSKGTRRLPKWDFDSFNPSSLIGYEKLATFQSSWYQV